MRISKLVVSLAAIAVVAWSAGAYTQQLASSHQLSFDDYLGIQQTYFTYSRDIDAGSTDEASSMFTQDGVFSSQERSDVVGAKDLKVFYGKLRANNKTGIRHFTTNLLMFPTADGVNVTSYMVTVERKEPSGPSAVTYFGMYNDFLVKTPEGWRFKHRTFTPDTFETRAAQ